MIHPLAVHGNLLRVRVSLFDYDIYSYTKQNQDNQSGIETAFGQAVFKLSLLGQVQSQVGVAVDCHKK